MHKSVPAGCCDIFRWRMTRMTCLGCCNWRQNLIRLTAQHTDAFTPPAANVSWFTQLEFDFFAVRLDHFGLTHASGPSYRIRNCARQMKSFLASVRETCRKTTFLAEDKRTHFLQLNFQLLHSLREASAWSDVLNFDWSGIFFVHLVVQDVKAKHHAAERAAERGWSCRSWAASGVLREHMLHVADRCRHLSEPYAVPARVYKIPLERSTLFLLYLFEKVWGCF